MVNAEFITTTTRVNMKSVLYLICLLLCGSRTFSYEGHQISKQSHIENIERPCPLSSMTCICNYFQSKLGCGPLGEHILKPYYLEKITADIPHSNASVRYEGVRLHGLNTGRITELYINRDADILVLEVELDKLIMDSERTTIIYHRKGKEPVEAADPFKVYINGLSLTYTIRDFHGSRWGDQHVYAYLINPKINLKLGAAHVDNTGKDGDVINLRWFEDMKLTAAEALISLGPIYMTAFFQTKICDMTITK